ncbi:MAG: exosortase [Candidatus Eisenbacteria bacterium]|nr:exosortase [Candidatus Eisenbacteria bacterium]
MSTTEDGRQRGNGRMPGPATGLVVGAVVVLVYLIYGDALRTLWLTWQTNANYSHGMLIPPIAAFLFWVERERFRERATSGTPWAIPFVVAALAVHVLSIRAGVFMTQGYSLVLLVAAVIALLFGGRALRAVWFSVAYLVFMLPMPPLLMSAVSFRLKIFAARAGSALAIKLGIPLARVGMTIHMPAGSLRIADPCSGLRSLIALLALGALFGYFSRGPVWKRVALFASALPIAVAANIVRIMLLCVVANVWGIETALGFFHDVSGVIIFVIALIGLFIVRRLLGIRGSSEEGE